MRITYCEPTSLYESYDLGVRAILYDQCPKERVESVVEQGLSFYYSCDSRDHEEGLETAAETHYVNQWGRKAVVRHDEDIPACSCRYVQD